MKFNFLKSNWIKKYRRNYSKLTCVCMYVYIWIACAAEYCTCSSMAEKVKMFLVQNKTEAIFFQEQLLRHMNRCGI